MSANLKPTMRTLVNITDGSSRSFLDDGSDVDAVTGRVKGHRVRRCILMQAGDTLITKGPHRGTPVFWAEAPLAPLFDGDPVAKFRVLDAPTRKLMAELVAERARVLDESKVQADNEAVLALATVKRANTARAQTA